jgi:hypothetical protein
MAQLKKKVSFGVHTAKARSMMEKSRQKSRVHQLTRSRLPRNTITNAVDATMKERGVTIGRSSFQRRIGDASQNIKVWKDVVDNNFESIWTAAEEQAKEDKLAGSAAESLSASEGRERIDNREGDDSDGEGDGEGDEEGDGEGDGEGDCDNVYNDDNNDQKEIRTCTVTLRQVLRPEMEPNHDRIVRIAEDRQRALTNVVDEISVLTRKVVGLVSLKDMSVNSARTLRCMSLILSFDFDAQVASGKIYDQHEVGEQEFDIRSLLPSEFRFRNTDQNPILDVAALPESLQGYLEACANGDKRGDEDIDHLLSKEHIQFLHARLTPTMRMGNAGVDEKHPVWKKSVNLIRSNSDASSLPPAPPDGLSTTILELIGQYSTNVKNLWAGAIYKKSLEYLTRILLRLHLAPRREQKYKDQLKTYSKSKKASNPSSMSRKTWRWRTRTLCDELADLLRKGEDIQSSIRVQAVLKAIHNWQTKEPRPSKDPPILPPLEEQLSQQDVSCLEALRDVVDGDEPLDMDDLEDEHDFEDEDGEGDQGDCK